jgi:hypothetical protein
MMTAAQRAKAYRSRLARGIAVYRVEGDDHRLADLLIELSLLTEARSSDRAAVAEAIAELLRRLSACVMRDAQLAQIRAIISGKEPAYAQHPKPRRSEAATTSDANRR